MCHSDLELVLEWRSEPSVIRAMFNQHQITIEEHRNWFENSVSNSNKNMFIFEMYQQPMGFVSFNEIENSGVAEWGFYLSGKSSKGLGRQLGQIALNHAFNQLKFHKIFGKVLDYNQASIKLHLALGFKEEGIFRDHYINLNQYYNIHYFGILSHEWRLF